MPQPDLLAVDWSKIPAPVDDGAADRLLRKRLPSVELPSTDGTTINLSTLEGRTVLYTYPLTGRPGVELPDGWDDIPGARGCTPQSCAFRDHHADLVASGASRVFGLSTQDCAYQKEASTRLHLPFALLSDAKLEFTSALELPQMKIEGRALLTRMALIIDDGTITHIFYPVFPPHRNAADVLSWLKENPL